MEGCQNVYCRKHPGYKGENYMWYWIVVALLIATAAGLIAAIFISIKKNKQSDSGYDEEYDRKMYAEDQTQRRQRRPREETAPVRVRSEERPRRKPKKQWKVILENLDTWEKFTYIFYDNIGIGRARNCEEFEKFLTVQDDPRVSKVHCVIIRKGEKLYLKDLGSRNGTYLNGQQIQQPVVIQRDDVIGVGETQIELQKVLRERD